jgi:hypothetical protein
MNLQEIIIQNINSKSYNLTQVEINWIKKYINLCPGSFINITNQINDIISDGKIDIHDIPKIIILISNIYYNNTIKNEIESDNIIVFVKITIDSIIESDLFFLPNLEKKILESLINSSLDLLKMNINIRKETTMCCNILKF